MKTWITIDLEYDFETDQTRSLTKVIPKLLKLLDENKIRATFFVLGEIVEKFPKLIKQIAKNHEIGSHGYTHIKFNKLTDKELWFQVNQSKKVIEKLGITCKGFRAPYFLIHPKLFKMLEKAGYEYDSSLTNSFFPGRYSHLSTKENKFKINNTKLMEYPVPSWTRFRFPPAGFSYYTFFYPISRLSIFEMPYMIYLHPCKFLDKWPKNKINFIVETVYKRNKGKKDYKKFMFKRMGTLNKYTHSRSKR